MSLFPSNPDIFVNKTGSDPIASSDPNNSFDAIEAIQGFIGASGNAQSKMTTLMNAFRFSSQPVPTTSYIDTDTIGIEGKGVVMHSGSSSYVIKYNAVASTLALSIGLDAGTEAAEGWYYVWLTGDGATTTYGAVFSTVSALPLPSSTYAMLIGAVLNSNSDILSYYQRKDMFMWDVSVRVISALSAAVWSTAITCGSGMPAISRYALFNLYAKENDSVRAAIWIKPNGSVGSTKAADGLRVESGTSTAEIASERWCFTDNAQQIQFQNESSDVAGDIRIRGYLIDV